MNLISAPAIYQSCLRCSTFLVSQSICHSTLSLFGPLLTSRWKYDGVSGSRHCWKMDENDEWTRFTLCVYVLDLRLEYLLSPWPSYWYLNSFPLEWLLKLLSNVVFIGERVKAVAEILKHFHVERLGKTTGSKQDVFLMRWPWCCLWIKACMSHTCLCPHLSALFYTADSITHLTNWSASVKSHTGNPKYADTPVYT